MNSKLIIRDCKRKRSETLDLSGQELSVIPEEVYSLNFVTVLNLSNNQVTVLDDKIQNMTALKELNVSTNNLSKLPRSLLMLAELEKVNFKGNPFEPDYESFTSYAGSMDKVRNNLKAVFGKKQKTFEEEFLDDDEFIFTPQKESKKEEFKDKDDFSDFDNGQNHLKDMVEKLKNEIKTLKAEKNTNMFSTTNMGFKATTVSGVELRNLDDVEEIKQISQGGFSIISRGLFRGSDVAIKKLFDPSNSVENKEEFTNEVEMLNRLRHPNIITMMGYYVSNQSSESVILFEHLSFGNLYEHLHLSKKKLDNNFFLTSLARVLFYIHKSGIVHKDIKSLNVLITEQGEPKLIDFGLATPAEKLNKGSKRFAATPAYSAPEIFLQKELSLKIDVYAFGVVAWEVLTTRVPFDGFNASNIRTQVLDGKKLDCSKLTSSYADLVDRCTATNPKDRPSFDEIIKHLKLCK